MSKPPVFSRLSFSECVAATGLGIFLALILTRFILETNSLLIITLSMVSLIGFSNLLVSWAKSQDQSKPKE